MIVWELFGVWALGCFLWHERRMIISAVLAGAVFGVVLGVVYTTGTAVFGSWWWLILGPWAVVAWQIVFAETLGQVVSSAATLLLMAGVFAYSGMNFWQAMTGLAVILKSGAAG